MSKRNVFVKFFKTIGPGLVTGAADDDPSGISTYSVAGASAGLSMLWLALVTTPMMAVVQGMCARIALVTGRGLAANIRTAYPDWLAFSLGLIVIVANTVNVGADVAGMSASAAMVVPLPVIAWVIFFGAVLILAQVYLSYRVFFRIIKWLTLALFAYVITAFVVHPPWGAVYRHLVIPEVHLNGKWIMTLVGVLGTTITPYLFFWQSALEVEQEKGVGKATVVERQGATREEIADAHLDVNIGMIFSNLIMFFIIVTTASTLAVHGKTNIATAQDAAEALRPLAGNFAYLLFTLGMVGTGLLAIPALAGSSAYVAAEMLRFRHGLDETIRRAPRFYAVLGLGILIGMLMNVVHVDPIRALFYSAVLNGVVAVPLVAVITLIASRRRLMGQHVNSLLANFWAWLTFAAMALAAIGMFVFWNYA